MDDLVIIAIIQILIVIANNIIIANMILILIDGQMNFDQFRNITFCCSSRHTRLIPCMSLGIGGRDPFNQNSDLQDSEWRGLVKNGEKQGGRGQTVEKPGETGRNREGAAVAKFETRIPQSSRLQQFPDLSSPSSLPDQEIVLMLRDQLQNSAVEEQDQGKSQKKFRNTT